MADFVERSIKSFSGLSSESKPTGVPNGSRWREIDTGKVFFYNESDTTWYQYSGQTSIYDSVNDRSLTIESNNALPVNIQDQTTEIVDLYFNQNLDAVTLASNRSIDDTSFDLVAGHGASVGNTLCLVEAGRYTQTTILSVVTNTITVDTPLDFAYTTAATCHLGEHDLSTTAGSLATPQIYSIQPPPTVEWDIVRIMIHIEDGTVMDSAKFGGITRLTNGVVLRVKNGIYKNIFNVKSNGEISERAYDIEYDPKAPAGVYGFRCRRTFGGQSKNGVVIRLDGDADDALQVLVQDDVTGLTHFHIIAQEHVVTD